MVPGVGPQHVRVDLVGNAHGVAVEAFVGDYGKECCIQRHLGRLQQLMKSEHPLCATPDDARGDQDQQYPESHGGRGFVSTMAVWVLFVRAMAGVMGGEIDQGVGQQVRNRVDAVGDERLRLSRYSHRNLHR